ncbi:MAG TPA: diguanylate cyclase [Bacilli bacterium]
MVQNLFNNLVLITLFLLITNYLLKKPAYKLTLRDKLLIGLIQAGLGVLLMVFTVHVNDEVIVDFRHLAIVNAAYFGGIYASLLTGTIIAAAQVFFLSDVNLISLIAASSAILTGVGTGILSHQIINFRLKWLSMMGLMMVILTVTLFHLLPEDSTNILFYFLPLTMIGGLICAVFINLLESYREKAVINKTTYDLTRQFRNVNISEMYESTIKALVSLTGCEYGSVITIEHGRYKVINAYERGVYSTPNIYVLEHEVESQADVKKGHTVLYPNWNRKRPQGSLELRFYEEGVRSSLHVPVIYDNKVIALINIGSTKAHHLTNKHKETVSQMTPLIGLAMTLKDSENKFLSVSDSANDAIILMDSNMNIISWNRGAQLIFNYSADEAIGQKISMIIPDHYRKAYHREIESLQQRVNTNTNIKTIELEGLQKDGHVFPIEISMNDWASGGLLYFSSIIRDITKRREAENRLREANRLLQRLTGIDGLTEIANRRSFDEMYDREWREGARSSSPLSLIMCDIDFFKLYNDTYGHQGGDNCLKQVARSFDTVLKRPKDFAARYGGEEFIVLLPDTDEQGAFLMAQSIMQAIDDLKIPHIKSKASEYVTVSLGVATMIPNPLSQPNILIDYADKSLYKAKLHGRNRIEKYNVNESTDPGK